MRRPFDNSRDGARIVLLGQHDAYDEILIAHGFVVRRLDEASACVRLIRGMTPAVVVIELPVTDDDGWELVQTLRSVALNARVKLIVLAGDASRASAERALMAGCDALLRKPCTPSVLLEEVRRLVASSELTPS